MSDDNPDFIDWVSSWGTSEQAVGTKLGYESNVQDFRVYERDTADYIFRGRMSTKKQVKTGTTQYWWGFVLQFDFKQALAAGNILQTFVVLKDQNEEFTSDYLNFMC